MGRIGIIAIASLLIAVMGCAGSSPEVGPVNNGEARLVPGLPPGWSGSSPNPEVYSVYLDKDIWHGGSASVKVESRGISVDEYVSVHQAIEAGDYVGKQVRFQAFLRTRKANSVGLWVRADSETHRAISFYNMHNRRVTGTTGWKSYNVLLDIPHDATVIYYGLVLEGRGEAWMDDCSLTVANDTIRPSTRENPGFAKEMRASAKWYQYPGNMDFEAEPGVMTTH